MRAHSEEALFPETPQAQRAERLKRGSYGQESTLKKIVPEMRKKDGGRKKGEGRGQFSFLRGRQFLHKHTLWQDSHSYHSVLDVY